MNEKINLGNFSMEKIFNGVNMGIIKSKSPAMKLNFELDNKFVLVGVHMLCDDNVVKYKYDLDGLNNNTLICIDRHHLIECIHILYGALVVVFKANKIENTNDIIDEIIYDVITEFSNILKCKDIDKISGVIINTIHGFIVNNTEPNKVNYKIIDKFKFILRNIWFLPYGEIDEIKNNIEKDINGGKHERNDDKPTK